MSKARDELDATLDRLFDENQAKLLPEERCAATVNDMCLARGDGYTCTRARGHAGDHVAHGRLGYIGHRWALASSRPVALH